MNRDTRLYNRSTLLQAGLDAETVDSLEVLGPLGGKDGRFQLITNQGQLQIPSCSYISRSIDDAWYIDTGVEIDQGQLYIGRNDFEGLASVAGYISESRVARTFEDNERLSHELALARLLITDLRNVVTRLGGTQNVETTPSGSLTQRSDKNEPDTRRDDENSADLDFSLDS